MSRSVLLQLARDSIQEVLEAQNTINKSELLQKHPLLSEPIATQVNIYLKEERKGYNKQMQLPLIDAIIIASKKAAFENADKFILTTSNYLSCEIELILQTPEGTISERDPAIV
jgi:hypothetical protein